MYQDESSVSPDADSRRRRSSPSKKAGGSSSLRDKVARLTDAFKTGTARDRPGSSDRDDDDDNDSLIMIPPPVIRPKPMPWSPTPAAGNNAPPPAQPTGGDNNSRVVDPATFTSLTDMFPDPVRATAFYPPGNGAIRYREQLEHNRLASNFFEMCEATSVWMSWNEPEKRAILSCLDSAATVSENNKGGRNRFRDAFHAAFAKHNQATLALETGLADSDPDHKPLRCNLVYDTLVHLFGALPEKTKPNNAPPGGPTPGKPLAGPGGSTATGTQASEDCDDAFYRERYLGLLESLRRVAFPIYRPAELVPCSEEKNMDEFLQQRTGEVEGDWTMETETGRDHWVDVTRTVTGKRPPPPDASAPGANKHPSGHRRQAAPY